MPSEVGAFVSHLSNGAHAVDDLWQRFNAQRDGQHCTLAQFRGQLQRHCQATPGAQRCVSQRNGELWFLKGTSTTLPDDAREEPAVEWLAVDTATRTVRSLGYYPPSEEPPVSPSPSCRRPNARPPFLAGRAPKPHPRRTAGKL